ncbi:MAG: hypothetical protein RDU20_15180, partial [Desulfomonilaceae bacterium]|nr:hypothetical protein [Desulfomonilaceae bacterium]
GGETRARQFQDLYDKFNNSLSELKTSSVRLRLHLDEEEVPECLRDLDRAIDSFPKARNDRDRGMVYDTLLDCLDDLIIWRRRKVSLLGASRETARLAGDVLTHGAQSRMYGEQLTDWDPSGPEQDPGIDEDLRSLDLRYNRSCYLRPHFRLLNLSSTYHREQPAGDPVLDAYLKAARKYEVPAESLLRIRQLISLADKTYSSIIAVINGVLNELTSPELAACLCLNPYEMPVKDRCLNVAQVVKEGAWLLFNPGIGRNSAIGDIVARALKTKFFETALSRTNKIRPLMYVADEFQRYLTGDAESSEALFLDRCRAYRVCCVLATQSLASLRYGLSVSDQTGSGSAAMEAALQILVNTTANKFFFRNTDPLTQEWLKTMIPECPRPGRPHLLDVRPVSSLKIGECYCLLGDGTYGLGKAAVESHPPVLKHNDHVAPSTKRKKTR